MNRPAALLVLSVALVACTATPPPAARRPSASRPFASQPSPVASKAPTGVASASPSPAPTPWPALQKPATATEELVGVVHLPRVALQAHGRGAAEAGLWRLPLNNPTQASNPIPPPTLMGAGGVLRGAASSLLDGQAEAEFARSGLLSNNGGGLVSNNGSSLVSDQGGGLISDHGSGYALATWSGVGRSLLQASAPESVLPVAGVAVAAIDLRSGKAIPVGEGPGGQPAYELLTDAQGRYRLHLPPKSLGHTLIISALSADRADPSGTLAALANLGRRDESLTPATAQVSRLMRLLAASRLERIMSAPDDAAATAYVRLMLKPLGGDLVMPLFNPLFLQLRAAAAEGGVPQLSPQQRLGVALRVADQGLSGLDFDTIELNESTTPLWFGPPTPLGPAMLEVLQAAHKGFEAFLPTQPQGYTSSQLPTRDELDESGQVRSWQASAVAQGLLKADFPLRNTYDLDVMLAHGIIRNADPAHVGTGIFGEVLRTFGAQDYRPGDEALYQAKFGVPIRIGAKFSLMTLNALLAIFRNLLEDGDVDGDGIGVQEAAKAIARQGAKALAQGEGAASSTP